MVCSGEESVCPSDVGDSVIELWVGYGVSISCARVECVPVLSRSRSEGDFPSNGVMLAHIAKHSGTLWYLLQGGNWFMRYMPI